MFGCKRIVAALLEELVVARVGNEQHAGIEKAQHVLTKHAIEKERTLISADPDLIAVIVVPERLGRCRLRARRFLDPFLRHDLFAFEPSAIEHHLSDLGDVLRQDIKSPTGFFVAHGALLPEEVCNAERRKQPGREVVRQPNAGDLLDDAAQHVGVHAVVVKARSGFLEHHRFEETLHPVGLRYGTRFVEGDPARHGQKVLDRNVAVRQLVDAADFAREEIDELVLQLQLALADEDADGQTCNGLALRMRNMPNVLVVRAERGLCDELAVSEHQHAVHIQRGVVPHVVEERRDPRGRNALGFRRCAQKRLIDRGGGEFGFLRLQIDQRAHRGGVVQELLDHHQRAGVGNQVHTRSSESFLSFISCLPARMFLA